MDNAIALKVLNLTTQVVAAHLVYNEVSAEALPDLIKAVYRSLATADASQTEPAEPPTPAVPVRKSVFPDFIVCLEDGRRLKTLKRHLMVSYGMTPAQYRAKWGLPYDYPMVAPNYAANRARIAKKTGLGRTAPADAGEPEAVPSGEPQVIVGPTRRAR